MFSGLLRRSAPRKDSALPPYLIVGLGNPGAQYERNRHNIGFMVIDALAETYDFSTFTNKHKSLLAKGTIKAQDVIALKPQTYMNRSGDSVGEVARYYKIPLERIIVIHDDLDLAPGKVKVKQGGGSGGHNGLKSLDAHLGPNYWRLRIGIGHPGHKDMVSDYVLKDFTAKEMALQKPVITSIAGHLSWLLEGNSARFLTEIAKDTQATAQDKKE